MNHPILSTNRKRWIYLFIWAIIILAHFFFLYLLEERSIPFALVDSLVYNGVFMVLSIWIWYVVKFNDFEIRKLASLVIVHLLAASLLIILWLGMSGFIMRLLDSIPYDNPLPLAPRIVVGAFFYLVIILIYYLYIYYENFRERLRLEAGREARYREAELSALKAQINPHFIFNSLNSISSLTLTDPGKAQEMIVKMSEFFRISLKKDQEQFTSLDNELKFAILYFDIARVRFGDKLVFTRELPEDKGDIRVPHLILQPLVENAVKHGVQESLQQTDINLRGFMEDGFLVLQLSNGFEPGSNAPGEGIGLQNVRERLTLMYGMTDLLRVRSGEGRFSAEVRIPLDTRLDEKD